MQLNVPGADLLNALQKQRNDAMDDAANNAAMIAVLARRLGELEKELAEAKKASSE